jgi:SH3-like domain-containing protein
VPALICGEPARFRSTVDSNGRTIWIADAHRDGNQRFVVRADEKLTAFLELESAIRTGQRLAASLVMRLSRVLLHVDGNSDCWRREDMLMVRVDHPTLE